MATVELDVAGYVPIDASTHDARLADARPAGDGLGSVEIVLDGPVTFRVTLSPSEAARLVRGLDEAIASAVETDLRRPGGGES